MENKRKKILIVDDDEDTRGMYVEVFKRADWDVIEAHDGVEGLDKSTKELPDLIFTGIVMPRMDGFELVDVLKKTVMTSKIPVVICSHMGREEDRKRAMDLGVKDFIVRDMTPPIEVLERVNSIFVSEGGEYRLEFGSTGLDGQKLAKDLSFNPQFECIQCLEKLAIELKLVNAQDRIFEAKIICPNCGWIAK